MNGAPDSSDLLGRPLGEVLRALAERGIAEPAVIWTSAFAGCRAPRGNRPRNAARIVRVRGGGRELTAALFLDPPDFSEVCMEDFS